MISGPAAESALDKREQAGSTAHGRSARQNLLWDFAQGAKKLDLRSGHEMTIAFVAERFPRPSVG
jgi:hypothetical protein